MFQFEEWLMQIKQTLCLMGNWKYLPTHYLDSKCFLKHVREIYIAILSSIDQNELARYALLEIINRKCPLSWHARPHFDPEHNDVSDALSDAEIAFD